jgi:hypothetical protein
MPARKVFCTTWEVSVTKGWCAVYTFHVCLRRKSFVRRTIVQVLLETSFSLSQSRASIICEMMSCVSRDFVSVDFLGLFVRVCLRQIVLFALILPLSF